MKLLPVRPRRAFTIAEMSIAVVVLGLVVTVVAEIAIRSLRERSRVTERVAVQEEAANLLEAARACPWEKLDATWADGQQLAKEWRDRGWKMKVVLDNQPDRPHVKRVTVEITFTKTDPPTPPVKLMGLFAARTREGKS
jgi:prepilin-type N-terminal cleavage/methylation domain-containing protein